MSRSNVILTGVIGLIGAALLTGGCLLVMAQAWIPILIARPAYGWGLCLFLTLFSVAEIPFMIFGMRRIAASANPKARYVAMLTNAGYSFFGAVYAAPFILLTGWLGVGAAMATLSLVRFATALIFLPR
ncbi:MAG: hypothetical protein AB1801_03065 [Chloroflexota bacterium]